MKVWVGVVIDDVYRDVLVELSLKEIFYFRKVADKLGLDVSICDEKGIGIGYLDFEEE